MGELNEKNASILRNHVLPGNAKELNCFLELLGLRKTSQPDDASELSTDGDSRKQRKGDEISVGSRFSDYLPPFRPYEDNNPNQRDFEVNSVALMVHVFKSLLLVDHDFFRKITYYLDLWLRPVGRSKLPRSLIPSEAQSVDSSVMGSLGKAKAVVIKYDL